MSFFSHLFPPLFLITRSLYISSSLSPSCFITSLLTSMSLLIPSLLFCSHLFLSHPISPLLVSSNLIPCFALPFLPHHFFTYQYVFSSHVIPFFSLPFVSHPFSTYQHVFSHPISFHPIFSYLITSLLISVSYDPNPFSFQFHLSLFLTIRSLLFISSHLLYFLLSPSFFSIAYILISFLLFSLLF